LKGGKDVFAPISIDDFIKSYHINNPGEKKSNIREALTNTVEAKKNGTKCMQCGQPIWAIGTAIVGWNGCFTCISGEADNSDDFEIDSVCF